MILEKNVLQQKIWPGAIFKPAMRSIKRKESAARAQRARRRFKGRVFFKRACGETVGYRLKGRV